jgi:formate--tetrahydrofolate ligase
MLKRRVFKEGNRLISTPLSDIEIARKTPLKPIAAIAAKLGIPEDALIAYGPVKAKIALKWLESKSQKPDSKLVLVTAISPTPAGEGKTTTTIGLVDGLSRLGVNVAAALREPSLGPCFGMKGGATGGGYAQVAPMEDINLHFTGDFHAITAAHNLLTALIDNHMYWGNALGFDPRKISWRRAMDMNDRALRNIVTGLDGNGVLHEEGFDITVASEVMAAFCLAEDMKDLIARLSRMVIARSNKGEIIRADALKGIGSMAALLKDAINPNIVQTLEGTPAILHGGPFANIAHGCNSVIATKAAMKLADVVVTEAGFGADLGAEKFLNIKCRQAGLKPHAVVLVATLRALKMHGGVAKSDLGPENVDAVRRGLPNLKRHLENMRKFGLKPVVAVNHFTSDTQAEFAVVQEACKELGAEAYFCSHWADGGKGTEDLAKAVMGLVNNASTFRTLYPDAMPLKEKIRTVAQEIYGAGMVEFSSAASKKLEQFEKDGFGNLPVCMAKTQYSFSSDPGLMGAPNGFTLPVRDVRLSAGAGFVVALAGDIMTMPGLPKIPAAERIGVDDKGEIYGLF